MTSRERITAAYRRQVPDRVPIDVRGFDLWTEPKHPSFQPLIDAVREKTDIFSAWALPTGTFMSATDEVSVTQETRPSAHADYEEQVTTIHCPAGDLTQVYLRSTIGKPGYHAEYFLKSKRDLEILLSVPYVPVTGDLEPFFQKDKELGDRGIVVASMSSDPMYHVQSLTGSETFAIWSVEERGMLHELVEMFYYRCRDYIRFQLQGGVGPFFGFAGPELCLPPLQSPRDFDEFVVEYDRRLIELVHGYGCYVYCHSHGRVGRFLERFADMGVDCLHPVEPPPMGDVTLAEAKRRVGQRMCLQGNIQMHDILECEPDEMRRIVAEAVLAGKPGGGFILCPTAGPGQLNELPRRALDNYLIMIEVGLEMGRY